MRVQAVQLLFVLAAGSLAVNSTLPVAVSTAKRLTQILRDMPASGRGLVTAAGGVTQISNLLMLLMVLYRSMRVDLPMEVFHYGEHEIDRSTRELIAREFSAVRLIDAAETEQAVLLERVRETAAGGKFQGRGFWLKPLFIASSSFEHVLWIDTDNMPHGSGIGLNWLFEEPVYKQHGAILWSDITPLTVQQRELYMQLGCEEDFREGRAVESGQLVVNRQRHLGSLLLAGIMETKIFSGRPSVPQASLKPSMLLRTQPMVPD
eukprot:TRINITY_DN17453_c0_g1_i4.p1 TRINITY_DN17453_c0_g1~~TRINITY_DN17453_c0_g1_i4.p1  ORF type:complete len:263 (-),score=59.43 TRINITY_DN17453_c0_g1_i4:782-1570(-)